MRKIEIAELVKQAMAKFYRLGEVLPFTEDRTHEFKAHTNLCVEDLPKWCFIPGTLHRTRRAVSRLLHALLIYNYSS